MYDAIVVGARCAGSPTAMLLAREGYRVLLVDRSTFPSDSMRNHFIQLPGVTQLHRWGLLDRIIASGCPPVRKQIIDLGDFPLINYLTPVDGPDAEYGPRRIVLDKILVDAAAEAGVEVREGFSVAEIVVENDQVVGIRGKSKGGPAVTERGRIVVGADGQHSLVAKTVRAATYNDRPALTCGYYSYWSGLECDALEVWITRRPAFLLAFPTNFGLTCIATQVPVSEFGAFRLDVENYFMKLVETVPGLAERLHAARREERFNGTADLPNFFRKPYGPGWALVGDAGYHKDPITAHGVSDAFRDAELLAEAIDAGFSGRSLLHEALAIYEERRNQAAVKEYRETCALASFIPFPASVYEQRAERRKTQGRGVAG